MYTIIEFDNEEAIVMNEDCDFEVWSLLELSVYINEGWVEGYDDVEQLF